MPSSRRSRSCSAILDVCATTGHAACAVGFFPRLRASGGFACLCSLPRGVRALDGFRDRRQGRQYSTEQFRIAAQARAPDWYSRLGMGTPVAISNLIAAVPVWFQRYGGINTMFNELFSIGRYALCVRVEVLVPPRV